jgi:hypothetical protein
MTIFRRLTGGIFLPAGSRKKNDLCILINLHRIFHQTMKSIPILR